LNFLKDHALQRTLLLFLLVTCLFASLITVVSQFTYIAKANGDDYFQNFDYYRHRAKITGDAQAPYRYRILSDYILAGVLRFTPGQLPKKYVTVSFIFRVAQNFFIFLAAFIFFRTMRFPKVASYLGLGLLAYGMCFAFNQADLSFYTYTELFFFLVAIILINQGYNWWILPLTILGAFNREESIFIPIMLMLVRLSQEKEQITWSGFFRRRYVQAALVSILAFFIIYFGLRYVIGPANYAQSRYGDIYPGLTLFMRNFLNPRTWLGIIQMYSLTLLALFFIKKWPKSLIYYLFGMALPWFAAEFMFASADGPRLFLVPFALIFVPAVISLLRLDSREFVPEVN
jgi:hypothetical protein